MPDMRPNRIAKVQDHAASTELRRRYATEHCGARLVWLSLFGLCLQLPLVGCVKERTEAEIEPDEATSGTPEDVVRITEVAQKQAGLMFAPAIRRLTQDSIKTTGWLQAIPGTEVVVRSPVAGYFSPESESIALSVGQEIQAGQRLGQVRVFFTPQEVAQLVIAKEEADILIEQSKVTLDIAEEQLRNLADSQASKAVAGTRLQELRAMAERARAALKGGQDKLPFLPQEPYDGSMSAVPVLVSAIRAGVVTDVHVVPQQFVVQGDPLYSIVNWETLWLHVPLFERDYHRTGPDAPGLVSIPDASSPLSVNSVAVPHAMSPGSRTISRYYSIANPTGALRPGQPLPISIPASASAESILVPRSSLLWDGLGNTWVYVRVDAESFRRTRVETGSASGEDIVIRRGLDEGNEVVTLGAETLYSEEFRGQLQAGDDD